MSPVPESRYSGRPLLRLLDCYVLALVDSLDPEMEARVSRTVRRLFPSDSNDRNKNWMRTLESAVQLPDGFAARVRTLWKNQPAGVDPVEFAIAISDANFVRLFDDA